MTTRHLGISDDDVVARIRGGDVTAFEALFRAYHPALVDFALGFVHDRDVAEELVAELFCTLWEHRTAWTVQASVDAYLFGAIRNRAQNALRGQTNALRRGERMAGEPEIPGMAAAPEPADEALERRETASRLWTAIDQLPEPRRSVVILRWREQLSFAEIGSALGISGPAAQMHLQRALPMLRTLLDDEFF